MSMVAGPPLKPEHDDRVARRFSPPSDSAAFAWLSSGSNCGSAQAEEASRADLMKSRR